MMIFLYLYIFTFIEPKALHMVSLTNEYERMLSSFDFGFKLRRYMAVLMLLAEFTPWYDIMRNAVGSDPAVTRRFLASVLVAFASVVLLGLRPLFPVLFRFLLEPDITPLFRTKAL